MVGVVLALLEYGVSSSLLPFPSRLDYDFWREFVNGIFNFGSGV